MASQISDFIKYQRKKLKLTQQQLADKAGVGVRFIRDLESGKETLQLDKVNQVLALFGFNAGPVKQRTDPYHVFWNYFNKAIKITMVDRTIKYGILIKEIKDAAGRIVQWKFVPNSNAIAYQKKPNDALTEVIDHENIEEVELQ